VVAALEVRQDARRLLTWYGVASVLTGSLSLDYLLPSLELFHVQSFNSVAQQSLYAIGIFALVRSPKDVIWVPVSIIVSSLLTSLIGWAFLLRAGFRFRFSIAPRRWSMIMGPSLHYAGSSLMSNLYHRSGHVAVRWFLGEHALGLYAAAARLADVLRNFLSIMQTVLMPRIALRVNAAQGISRLTRLAVSVLIWFGVPFTVGGIITAPVVVPWILGAQFHEAVRAFQWVTPYMITAPAAVLFAGIIYAAGRHRAYFVSTAIGAISAVVLCVTLTPLFGVPGACLAYVLGELAVAISAYLLCPLEVRETVRTPVMAVALIASLIMAAALWLTIPRHLHPLALIAVGSLVYVMSWAILGRNLLRREAEGIA
jgi:O-antigen/teichoic acid export membrane protein